MNRYEDPQTAAVMSVGMSALRKALPPLELEVFLFKLKTDDFDYTEWRRDNLWVGMTAKEIMQQASEDTKGYVPPKGAIVL
jgi:hypothetical protein